MTKSAARYNKGALWGRRVIKCQKLHFWEKVRLRDSTVRSLSASYHLDFNTHRSARNSSFRICAFNPLRAPSSFLPERTIASTAPKNQSYGYGFLICESCARPIRELSTRGGSLCPEDSKNVRHAKRARALSASSVGGAPKKKSVC